MRHPASALSRAVALSFGVAALAASFAAPAAAQPAPSTAAAAAPAAPSTSAWAGVYRVSLTRGSEVVPARVLLERVDGTLYGTFLMDGMASALGRVRIDASEFRANLVTAGGRGEIVLRSTDEGVVGTLTVGRATWEIRGGRSV